MATPGRRDGGDEDDAGGTAKVARISGAALIAAGVVLIAFGAFVAYLISQQSARELVWTRLAWVFSSVEAIAFGAAGALFGSSIQRSRAEKAEEAAAKNADAASKGKALAAAIKADAGASGTKALEALGPGTAQAASSVVARHAALASELFP
jgi:uncharacterized membrane protein YsdA (DUF1294 family)